MPVRSSNIWFVITFVILGAILAYVFVLYLRAPVVPPPPVVEPPGDEAPVVSPEIEELEEVVQYTGGRPIPEQRGG